MLIDKDLIIPHQSEISAVGEFGLGRIAAFDPRDRKFAIRPPAASKIDRRSMQWITGAVLNQGATSQCVAYSGEQFLASSPVRNPFYKTPAELYAECQQNDEWDGTDYDGTSVRALFKVLREKGYIESWQNAFDIDTVVRHLLTTSPVILGTSWDYAMFEPFVFGRDKATFIKRGGGQAGGHAYLLKGVNLDRACHCGGSGAARILNSWGKGWGDGGKAWVCLKELSSLISESGEAVTSKELKFTPVM